MTDAQLNTIVFHTNKGYAFTHEQTTNGSRVLFSIKSMLYAVVYPDGTVRYTKQGNDW